MSGVLVPNTKMTPGELRAALRRARRARYSDEALFVLQELSVRDCTDAALIQKALEELKHLMQSKPWSGMVYEAKARR